MYKSTRGFTLIELVVSIAILSLMVFGISQLFPRGLQVTRRAEATTAAANLAQAQIETSLAQDYPTILVGTSEARHPVVSGFERQTLVSFRDPATLTQVGDDRGLKRIDVTVFFQTSQGERAFALSTLIARQ